MAKKTAKKSAHDWQPVREYVTTKNPDKVWTVEQNELGELRCHCPGWIFRHRTGHLDCKHIRHYKANPSTGLAAGVMAAKTAWRDSFEAAVRAAFTTRFGGIYNSYRPDALVERAFEDRWRAFVDDLRLLAPQPVAQPTTPGLVGLGVRRVVLDD